MRQVTEQTCKAFLNGDSLTVGNTTTDGQNLWLHGNLIATKDARGTILISFAGWPTRTTTERLNGLCELAINKRPFYTEQFVMKLNGVAIDDDTFYPLPRCQP